MTTHENDVDFIINKFGGLRPMATKTGIPMTTIQGWKKRNKIPKKRFDELNKAAAKHDIDLTAPMDLNIRDIPAPKAEKRTPEKTVKKDVHPKPKTKIESNYQKDLAVMEARIMKKNRTYYGALCGLILIAIGVIVWPKKTPKPLTIDTTAFTNETRALHNKVTNLEQTLPKKMSRQIKNAVNQAVTKTQEQHGAEITAIQNRLDALDIPKPSLSNGIDLNTFYVLVKDKLKNKTDAAIMDRAIQELTALYQSTQAMDPAQTKDAMINEAREQSASLQIALKDVPQKDLQAAVYLLALTKMRETLNRDNEPFEADYGLLKQTVASDNPELRTALDRLAPAAAEGILTQDGLSNELKTLSADIITASLQGEDVSVSDKARARLNTVLNIEKDGKSLTATADQIAITQAQEQIDDGDIQGAIETLQALENDQNQQMLNAFIAKAETTLQAKQVQTFIHQALKQLPISSSGGPYQFGE